MNPSKQIRRRTTLALVAALAVSVLGAAYARTQVSQEATRQANVVFVGTIVRLGAVASSDVQANTTTAVVRVDQMLRKPDAIATYEGREITVQLLDPSAFSAGDTATFYTQLWTLGTSLAVTEIASTMEPTGAEMFAAGIQDLEQAELTQRVEAADVIAAGRVVGIREVAETATLLEDPRPQTEHDPQWREATIEVSEGLKGLAADVATMVVRFPGTLDVAWVDAPRFEIGDTGVFFLRNDQLVGASPEFGAGATPGAFTMLNAADVLSADVTQRVRDLVGR